MPSISTAHAHDGKPGYVPA